jgi:hypothetical protein
VARAERDQLRRRFLIELYERSGGNKAQFVNFREIGAALGLDEEPASVVAQWLVDHGLAEWPVMGGSMAITPEGVDAAEDEQDADDEAAAVLLALTPVERGQVEATVTAVLRAIDSGEIELPDPDDQADLRAQLDTTMTQLRSPRPKRRVISAALRAAGDLRRSSRCRCPRSRHRRQRRLDRTARPRPLLHLAQHQRGDLGRGVGLHPRHDVAVDVERERRRVVT